MPKAGYWRPTIVTEPAGTVDEAEPTLDIGGLGLAEGALLLIRRALAERPLGGWLRVSGQAPDLDLHLLAWCRQAGHRVEFVPAAASQAGYARVQRGATADGRWRDAVSTSAGDGPAERAAPGWGLAARGATVEAGSPRFDFALSQRHEIWAETAGELYRQAMAAQWDPAVAIDWQAPFALAPAIEAAVVQVMTYLIENENAALLVPARHLGQIHPHFREVMQLLALQCADEARHVEVFTRRAGLKGHQPALSSAGGQASLKTLFDAPDFSTATFLLAVLGEGTFVNLLNFLQAHAPDPVLAQVARLAARDEARHVAFGMAHLEYRLSVQPDYQVKLRNAIETRYDTLAGTAGLNEEVFDALVLLAAGALAPEAIARGHAAVAALKREMAAGRKAKLIRLGFERDEAERLSNLHTRNFM